MGRQRTEPVHFRFKRTAHARCGSGRSYGRRSTAWQRRTRLIRRAWWARRNGRERASWPSRLSFDPPVRCGIGMGGQKGTSYSSCEFATAKAQIVLESTSAVPLVIGLRVRRQPGTAPIAFYLGVRPRLLHAGRRIRSEDAVLGRRQTFRERQEFQVVNGVWIFKQGDSWKPPASLFDESRHIQRVRLVDLCCRHCRVEGSTEGGFGVSGPECLWRRSDHRHSHPVRSADGSRQDGPVRQPHQQPHPFPFARIAKVPCRD